MRSDYGLYSVAVICFVISGVFMTNAISGYTLENASGITVITVFLLLGIISAAVGYSARPKAMMPTTQPTPTPTAPTPETPSPLVITPPSPAEQIAPEPLPPPPSPLPEPSTPMVTPSEEAEQPVKLAEEEKPKPVRRRRKKTQ